MENSKLKLGIFIILFGSLLVAIYYGVVGFSFSYLTEKEIKLGREIKTDLINTIKINNMDAIYNKNNNTYYYSVPDDYENKHYTLKLELQTGYKYKILNSATNVIKVDYNKEYSLLIYNDKYYYESKLILTNLPILSITTDTKITDNDTNSVFKYINPYNLDSVVSYNSKIHIRGATTRIYDKKCYKLEVYDNDYENEKKINISNFYYGSSFILDAMYRDPSKIRNVLAIDLWNGISDDFSNIDIYSEYVELFVNDEYVGLYTFTEPINRKSLNLNKSTSNNTSVIIKSNDWTFVSKDSSYKNISSDTYMQYELKYPNDEELFSKAWQPVLTKLAKYYRSKENIKYDELIEIFDINNYVDLMIFNSFLNNGDNKMIKNNYFYLKNLNSKLNVQPWDMEFSFGLRFSSVEQYNFKKTIDDYDQILIDIKHSSKRINKLLINRYWELRKNILSREYFDKLIDQYKKELTMGADKRESEIWLDHDMEKEIEEVRTWLYNRLEIFDNYIRGLENE